MLRKIGLFILSLWLLFLLIIIITIHIPYHFGDDWQFVGCGYLLSKNVISIICFVFLFIGWFSYRHFRFVLKGSPDLSFEIEEIESVDYEHLTFLTTYIVPLVCFNFDNNRYIIAFGIILFVIGIIYVRTDLFYANPSLALLRFRIYKVKAKYRNGEVKENKILISKDLLSKNDRVKYIKLDERIFYTIKV